MATPNAHTEASGAPHKEAFPPFNAETFPSQLLWLAITFAVLYLITAKLALPRVGAILEARRDRIAGDLAEAQRLKADSDAALAAYEQSLTDARSRAQAVANQRREKQNAEAEATRRALEQSLHAKSAEADAAIAKTKAAAMSNVRDIAADAAANIVARLIGTAPSSETVRAAVADVLKR
jgi:F-type H+-transporting ATPase subunit b